MSDKTQALVPASDSGYPKFSTLNGEELRQLKTGKGSHYLVMELPDALAGSGQERVLQLALESALRLAASLSGEAPRVAIQASPRTLPTASADDAQARLSERILRESEWLTARDISIRAGLALSNPSAAPNRWKAKKRIFALSVNGRDYYPAYGLDEGYTPLPVMARLIALFGERKTPWGMAVWLGSDNSWLGGRKPKDLLTSEPEAVCRAAQAEIQGPVHG
ncbi:DUF2384 domain-containing protein [Jejubacter calystegiae]|uniref:DUF2384 domain-containing protein n=1 Tax=Jejubacter calystegiae TaxID=2579935 RepID=A0A4P8YK05_9ENTR|nr:antitoxin Xre/MbcA/ParS toxin-binding domain-containing protein [Jejubacter calystegiae]QCT21101.1 DUF2384 domain-containing protein [Jejubacter calystegiae]